MLVRLARGLGVRTALLTVTRGEGGQNAIGPELFDALGVLRTGRAAVAAPLRRRRAVFRARLRVRLLVQRRGDVREVGPRRDAGGRRARGARLPSRRDPDAAAQGRRRRTAPLRGGAARARSVPRRGGPRALSRPGAAGVAGAQDLHRRRGRRQRGGARPERPRPDRRLRRAPGHDLAAARRPRPCDAPLPGRAPARRRPGPLGEPLRPRRLGAGRDLPRERRPGRSPEDARRPRSLRPRQRAAGGVAPGARRTARRGPLGLRPARAGGRRARAGRGTPGRARLARRARSARRGRARAHGDRRPPRGRGSRRRPGAGPRPGPGARGSLRRRPRDTRPDGGCHGAGLQQRPARGGRPGRSSSRLPAVGRSRGATGSPARSRPVARAARASPSPSPRTRGRRSPTGASSGTATATSSSCRRTSRCPGARRS